MSRRVVPSVVNLCIVLASLFPAIARAAIIEWPVASGGNGHFYSYVGTPATWGAAANLAASSLHNGMSGYLATVTSAAENNFLIANFNLRGFLGGSDAEVEGDWRWVVGPEAGQLFFQGEYPDPNRETLIYSDWGGNEPNDFDNRPFGFPYAGEDYLQFDPERGSEWNDVPGDPYMSDGYYVEFSAIPEPSAFALAGIAAIALLTYAARRRFA